MLDFRSDTVTKPSDAMRAAAADAEVGDDVYGEDPTVNDLERRTAEVLGTEDALFFPTGTMANQAAVRVHADRGTEALVDAESHLFKWELGGLAQLAGVQTRTVDAGDRAVFTAEQVHANCHVADDHRPGTGLVAVENTHNARGGIAVPVARLREVADAAADHGVPVHLDGARLFNACVARDTDPAAMVAPVDSVMVSLSKGLGAPVGSMLAGSADFVAAARRVRKLYGGGMRQAGVVAAPGLLALENRDRLAEDHANARRLAEGLAAIDGLSVQSPETNIVVVDSADAGLTAAQFVEVCDAEGVACGAFGPTTTRFCTHLDVDGEDVEAAISRVAAALD